MGVLNNALGINLTVHEPLLDSPFTGYEFHGQSFPPPGSGYMITETGIYMITETALERMITEG